MAQPVNVAQFSLAAENLLRPFAGETERARERAEQLNDLGNMIVIFAIFSARLRIEKVVARDELKDLAAKARMSMTAKVESTCIRERIAYHSCHTPYIRAGAPFCPQDDFGRAVLTGLDVVSKVVAYPTSVTQISDLDRNGVHRSVDIILTLVPWRTAFVERNAGDVFGEYVA